MTKVMGGMPHFWIVLGVVVTSEARCPNGWMRYENSCYLFGNDLEEFSTAGEFCRQHSGHLVHIETAEENYFLRDWLKRFKPATWWIGLSDSVIEHIWAWSDIDVIANYTDWIPGQPDDYNSAEDCASFKEPEFQWNDIPCNVKELAICEKKDTGEEVIVGRDVTP